MASTGYSSAQEIQVARFEEGLIDPVPDDPKSRPSVDTYEIPQHNVSPGMSFKTEKSWSQASRSPPPSHRTERSSTSLVSASKRAILSRSESWTFEIISLLISATAVAGIIGILSHFDGRPLPDWPMNITLNTLIALLATLANANLAIPLQNGISQLKWLRFQGRPTPLSDMEAFDNASRGTWGAIKLIFQARGGVFGSFGAAIALFALALGPLAQQTAVYHSKFVRVDAAATVPAALNYTGALAGNSPSTPFVPILPMKSAVYYGLFSESDPSANLKVNCPTGNCTWPAFTTLAVCSSCVDLTPYMTRYCMGGTPADGNISDCGWQVPQGGMLNSSSTVFSMTSQTPDETGNVPYTNLIKLVFMGTEAQNGPPLNYNPWASQCTLQYCLQTVNSSVTNGDLAENVTLTTQNMTVVDVLGPQDNVPVILRGGNQTYTVGRAAMLGTQSWFSDLFTSGGASRNHSFANFNQTDDSVVVNLTVGISSGTTYFDSDIVQTFYWDYYEYANGLDKAMSDLATAMTVAFRSSGGAAPVPGDAFIFESYVHVRWGWIAFPVLAILLTTVFLGAAVWQSRRYKTKLWKSSALATLFHGLDHEARRRFAGHGSLVEKRQEAKSVRVQLVDEDGAGSLLRCS